LTYPSRDLSAENGGEMTALWRDEVGDPDALVRDGLAFLRARGKERGVL
jgi:hypothetical protein